MSANPKYTPIDELLRIPSVRILRALKHQDWITSGDLFELLSVPHASEDRHVYGTHSKALSRHVQHGYVESRLGHQSSTGVAHLTPSEYRITTRGRSWLAQRMEYDLTPASDKVAAEGRESEVAA
ncbi:MAG: hypothetical protein ACTHU0_19285 [Kofleriaceae bacterium]